MPAKLDGRKVAFLATDGVAHREFADTWRALQEAGALPHLISERAGAIKDDAGDALSVDAELTAASVADYEGLVLPGGATSATTLSTNKDAIRLVRDMMEADKPVAAICHGVSLLLAAESVEGRTLTSPPDLRKGIEDGGGEWVDKQVQADQRLITSRKPEDLPAFITKVVALFAGEAEQGRVDEASQESFPASDAPAWGPSSIGGQGASAQS